MIKVSAGVLFTAMGLLIFWGLYDKLKSGEAHYFRPRIMPDEAWERERQLHPEDYADDIFRAKRASHPGLFWFGVVLAAVLGTFTLGVGVVALLQSLR